MMTVLWLIFLISKVSRADHENHRNAERLSKSCDKGWFPFGDMCYMLGGKKEAPKQKWVKAEERCKELGGHLATINSMELQEFLEAFILVHAKSELWIGLNDRGAETVYHWTDGSPFNFTYWAPTEPREFKDESEDCVELFFIHDTGQWNDVNCENEQQFICQRNKDRKTSRRISDPRFCPSRENGGWRYEMSCFNVIHEKKSWDDAEMFCQANYKGHLVSIHDPLLGTFIKYIVKNETENIWIGVKAKENVVQKWVSGWFVSHHAWAENIDFSDGTCAALDEERRWTTIPCSEEQQFICQSSAVWAPPPVLKPGPVNSQCPSLPHNWLDLDGEYCYYFEKEKSVSWYEASFHCRRRGGHLVSIHSEDESRMILHFLEYTQRTVHIGLFRHITLDERLAWSDGTPLDFNNFEIGEPNNNNEQCGEFKLLDMKWNDMSCTSNLKFVCHVQKSVPNSTKDEQSCIIGYSMFSVIGIVLCVIVVSILVFILAYCLIIQTREQNRDKKNSTNSNLHLTNDRSPKYRRQFVVTDQMYANIS